MFFFFLTLGVMIFASIMCRGEGDHLLVVLSWAVWFIGFFSIPALFGSDAARLTLQGIIGLVLLLKWQVHQLK